MNQSRLFTVIAAVALCAAVAFSPSARALVENQSFGIFGVTPVTTQPSGAGQSALTDSTTGTAGTTLAAGVGVQTITIPLQLAALANGDVVTEYVPGYKFKILSVSFATTTPASTAAKLATLNLEIGTTNVTGGAVALTTAACDAAGELTAGSAVTAANTGASTDSISVEAASVTAFVEGAGVLLIKVQNMDTADAVASLARQSTSWRSLLVALGLAKGSS